VLDEAWPHLSKALAVQGRAQLEPILAANKPAWLASLQLSRCRPSGMGALHALQITFHNQRHHEDALLGAEHGADSAFCPG